MSLSSQEVNDPREWMTYVPQTLKHSPLYANLYAHIEKDPEILALFDLVDKNQPIPVMFFTVINYLLLRDHQHPFAAYFPYLQTSPLAAEEAYPAFRDFCVGHMDEIRALLPGLRLQTNEVTRCANLLPAFEIVSQRGGRLPLSLVELGASAGLNLNWDQYQYAYGDRVLGQRASAVQIRCTLEGESLPPLPEVFPAVAQRIGIDLGPLDITDEHNVRLLRACIWPEERERYVLLDAAIRIAHQRVPQVLAGDASALLPGVLATIPAETTLCLWHTFALNQGPVEVRRRIETQIAQASLDRTVYTISIEVNPTTRKDLPRLELCTYQHGELVQREHLANCTLHGEKMEWVGPRS